MAVLIKAHDEPVYSVRFVDTDRIVTAATTMKLWRYDAAAEADALKPADPKTEVKPALVCTHTVEKPHLLGTIAMDKDTSGTTLVSTGFDGSIAVWDCPSLTKRAAITASPSEAWAVVHSPTAPIFATGGQGATVHVWNSATGERLRSASSGGDFINSVAFSPDGRHVACACANGSVQVMDVETGVKTIEIDAHFMAVRSVAFSHDGLTLYTGSEDRRICAWDISGGGGGAAAAPAPLIFAFSGHMHWVTCLAPLADKPVFASGSCDRTVRVWDARRRECVRTFEGHSDRVWTICWNSATTRIASGAESGAVGLHTVTGVV